MKIFIAIFLLSFSHLYAQEIDHVTLNYSVEYNQSNKYIVSKIAIELQEFIKKQTFESWITDDFFLMHSNQEFIKNLSYGSELNFQPTILAITPLENNDLEYIVKVGFINSLDERFYINSIYSIIAVAQEGNEVVKFKNIFAYNLEKLEKTTIEEASFYHHKEFMFDEFEASLFVAYNKRIAKFFDSSPISFDFITCENYDECMRILGYDIEINMFGANKIGSITYPGYKLILSGNNKSSNIHELIHLYTYQRNPYRNSILDEGLAVFFGGSKGYDFNYHIASLKEHLKENDIDIVQQLFYDNYVIDENTSLKYTMGGVITKLLLQKGGKDLFLEVFMYSDSNESLIEKLEEVLQIDKSELNQYFKNYLQKI